MTFTILNWIKTNTWEGALLQDKEGKQWLSNGIYKWTVEPHRAYEVVPFIDEDTFFIRWRENFHYVHLYNQAPKYLSFIDDMVNRIETWILCWNEEEIVTRANIIHHIKRSYPDYIEEVHNGEYLGEIFELTDERIEQVYTTIKTMMLNKFKLTIQEESQMSKPTQTQIVIDAMNQLGGFASLSDLYAVVLNNANSWKTKTPEATIRRIVQNEKYFFKMNRGIFGLNEHRERLYVKGSIIEQFGSKYLVSDVYFLSDEYMREHNLVHRHRVTLTKVEGDNGLDRYDFAFPMEEPTKSPKCQYCGHETETAEYLEGENSHESAQMCVNEDCEHFGKYIV